MPQDVCWLASSVALQRYSWHSGMVRRLSCHAGSSKMVALRAHGTARLSTDAMCQPRVVEPVTAVRSLQTAGGVSAAWRQRPLPMLLCRCRRAIASRTTTQVPAQLARCTCRLFTHLPHAAQSCSSHCSSRGSTGSAPQVLKGDARIVARHAPVLSSQGDDRLDPGDALQVEAARSCPDAFPRHEELAAGAHPESSPAGLIEVEWQQQRCHGCSSSEV